MAENITRCPKCNTSFRISQAHLKSAKGAVRCGSCLHIFNAKEYLISSNTQPLHSTEQKEQRPTQPPQNRHVDDEQEILISDDMGDHNGLVDDDRSTEQSEKLSKAFGGGDFSKVNTGEYNFNLFERAPADDEEDEGSHTDESWALDLLAEENSDPEKHTTTAEPRDEEPAPATEEQVEKSNAQYENSFQIIGEAEHEESDNSPLPSKHIFDEPLEEEEHYVYQYDDDDSQYSSASNSHYLDAIEPEPVEFNWQRHGGLWQSKILWATLSLLAGIVLIGQVAWLKFDTLSVVDPYRTYYAKACEIISCTLPDLLDRSKIKTANLIVRSHPRVKDALVVDAVLQNMARFEQTFPTLDLVFTDTQDKAVASRRLNPRDYLAGELAGRTHMPIKQPIHIAVEIADPGRQAVGYKISIVD